MDPLSTEVKAFFVFLDTDKNKIVDGLECLAGLAILLSMPIREKLEYIYRLYDFERRDRLVVDEMSMAAVCLCTALEKMTPATSSDTCSASAATHAASDTWEMRTGLCASWHWKIMVCFWPCKSYSDRS